MINIKSYSKGIRILAVLAAVGIATGSTAQEMAFSGPEDVAYAEALWVKMEALNLVGANAIRVQPFEGNEPHGAIQEVLGVNADLDGHNGLLLVKRNHGGEGVDIQAVYDDPIANLAAITIMFKREGGYDADNQDWFWAKYLPDGTLDKNPKGMQLAGRVAKGADTGCISCHTGAGEDMRFLTSK